MEGGRIDRFARMQGITQRHQDWSGGKVLSKEKVAMSWLSLCREQSVLASVLQIGKAHQLSQFNRVSVHMHDVR